MVLATVVLLPQLPLVQLLNPVQVATSNTGYQRSTEGRKEEPRPPQIPPGLGNNDNVKPDVSLQMGRFTTLGY